MSRIICVGSPIMDMFPDREGAGLADVGGFRPVPGGSAANVAVCAAKLGQKSCLIGKVGDDAFGRALAGELERCGVDTSSLRFDAERRTTVNFHAKPQSGGIEYLFYRNPGADTGLKPEEVDFTRITSAKAVHFDSLCFTDEPTRGTAMNLAHYAKESGVLVSFDFNYRPPLWRDAGEALEAIREILPLVDILKVNEDEFTLLMPDTDMEEGALALCESGPGAVIVTLGASGSFIVCDGMKVRVPAMKVKVVDTIGCGDAFIGSFLSYLSGHGFRPGDMDLAQLNECTLYADTAASLTAARHGAMSALPGLAEVEEAWAKRRGGQK